MFEIKCDVKGCGTRDLPAQSFGQITSLPPGWRVLTFDEPIRMPKPTVDPVAAMTKLTKKLGMPSEFAEFVRGVSEMSGPTVVAMPQMGRRVQKYICPQHDMPEFDDGIGVDDDEDITSPGIIRPTAPEVYGAEPEIDESTLLALPEQSIEGASRDRKTVTFVPDFDIMVRKIIADDTSPSPGLGTRICDFRVDGVSQRPTAGGGTLSLFLGPMAKGNTLKWDVCPAGKKIEIDVEFLQACTWKCTLKGDEVAPQ